jgi:hypothetical protein
VAHSQPIVSDDAGRFPLIWISDALDPVTLSWETDDGQQKTYTGLTVSTSADTSIADDAQAALEAVQNLGLDAEALAQAVEDAEGSATEAASSAAAAAASAAAAAASQAAAATSAAAAAASATSASSAKTAAEAAQAAAEAAQAAAEDAQAAAEVAQAAASASAGTATTKAAEAAASATAAAASASAAAASAAAAAASATTAANAATAAEAAQAAAELARDEAQAIADFDPSDYLAKSDNLSGLTNTTTARSNLGLGALATVTPGTGVATALAANVGSAGAPVLFNGAGGTPSSLTLTNASGLPLSGVTSSTSTALGVGSLEVGHATDTTITRSSAGVIAVEGVTVALNSTSSAHTASTIELGHASDTTLSRSSAGVLAVEGVTVAMNSTSATHTAGTIELGAASDTTLSRSAAGVLAVEGTPVAMAGKQAIYIPAGAMVARTTNGAAAGTVETTTNKIMLASLDFDASTIEYAQFKIRMPKSWNEGTVSFVPEWSHASTSTNFKVSWGLQGVAISDDDAGDAAFGTAQYSNDTGGTTDDFYAGPESSAITIAGTPAAEDLVVFQVLRKADDGTNDTLAIDARLLGITLYITTDAGNDA